MDDQIEYALGNAHQKQNRPGEGHARVEEGKVDPNQYGLKVQVLVWDGKDGVETDEDARRNDDQRDHRLEHRLDHSRAKVVGKLGVASGLGEKVGKGYENEAKVGEDEDEIPDLLDELVVEPHQTGILVGGVVEHDLVRDDRDGQEEADPNGNGQSEDAQLERHPIGDTILRGGRDLETEKEQSVIKRKTTCPSRYLCIEVNILVLGNDVIGNETEEEDKQNDDQVDAYDLEEFLILLLGVLVHLFLFLTKELGIVEGHSPMVMMIGR